MDMEGIAIDLGLLEMEYWIFTDPNKISGETKK